MVNTENEIRDIKTTVIILSEQMKQMNKTMEKVEATGEKANELKAQILELNPTAKFPNDVDTNNNEVASIEELQTYLDLLKTKALLNKFEG